MQDAFKDTNGEITQVELDSTGSVPVVEGAFYYKLMTADGAVKAGSGTLHTITFTTNDAAPTAGTIDVYDSLAASGTKILSWTLTTAVFYPTTVLLDVTFGNGLYIVFTTTADVNVTFSYK